MSPKKKKTKKIVLDAKKTPYSEVEEIMEKNLEDIATIVSASGGRKSKVYEDVMSIVEKGLFKIALRRCEYVKSSAAEYLGINRNTFTDKMAKLGIKCEKKK
ncbi:MAG TPA: hypothetical protein ENN23_07930 [Deltaproteobacteria bacterium]|nr:hypothetical protein [Deltaproteobacteria bacterium]